MKVKIDPNRTAYLRDILRECIYALDEAVSPVPWNHDRESSLSHAEKYLTDAIRKGMLQIEETVTTDVRE